MFICSFARFSVSVSDIELIINISNLLNLFFRINIA